MKYNLKIKGLDCANCASNLETKINRIDGIEKATISFIMEKMTIECNENKKQEIIEKMKKVIKKEEPDCTIEEI